MKKIISMILVAVLLCTSLPMSAYASEDEIVREELLTKACEAFPEFADKITNPQISMAPNTRSTGNQEPVYTETRQLSDTETIIYTEYASGLVLLTGIEGEWSRTVNDYESSSFAVIYDINITASLNEPSGTFRLKNVKYTLVNNGYDAILSKGTPSRSTGCNGATEIVARMNETASQDAMILYELHFQFASSGYYTCRTELTLTVGDNRADITHVNTDA